LSVGRGHCACTREKANEGERENGG
jgi:hypothetical protein